MVSPELTAEEPLELGQDLDQEVLAADRGRLHSSLRQPRSP